jgi:hypothetical protein
MMGRKSSVLRVVFAVFLLGISGCAVKPPIAENSDTSAVAISVSMESMTAPLMVENVRAKRIIFVRLEAPDDSLKKTDVFTSNFRHTPPTNPFQTIPADLFSMNLEPGIYAAVGAIGKGETSKVKFLIYFPEKMIAATVTQVYPDRIAYMGEYRLSRMNFVEMATPRVMDEAQEFYFSNNIFDSVMRKGGKSIAYIYKLPVPMVVSLDDAKNSIENEIEFLERYMETFEGSEWESKLQGQIDMLKRK